MNSDNPQKLYHTFSLYSAQKNKELGKGTITKRIRAEGDYMEKVLEMKKAQELENAEYKKKLLAGESVPVKFHRRVVLGVPVANVTETEDQPPEGEKGRGKVRVGKKVMLKADTELVPVTPMRPDNARKQASMIASLPSPEEVHRLRTTFHLRLTPHTGNTLYVLGSSKRGKSTAIMKIYDDYFGGVDRNYVSVLWSVNPQIGAYKGHSKLIKAKWHKTETTSIIKIQQQIQRKTNNEYKFLNIFDDVLHVRGDETMENLIMTYRNSKISSIIAMQYTNQLQKNCRANVNGVLLFGFNTDESIEVVVKCYLRSYLHHLGIINMPDMVNWYKRVTDDHGFIYVIPETGEITLHKFRM
jgi:hypothetical protein